DVGTGPKPFYDVSFAIPHGSAAGLEPAVHAVRTADAVFHVVWTATGHRVGPEPPGRLPVVQGQRRQPAPAQPVIFGHGGVLRPLRAEVITGAIGRGAPDQLRQRLGQAPPTLLALAQRLLCPLPLGDVQDSAEDEEALAGLDGGEANLDWEFASVLAPAVQLAACPHRPGRRGSPIAGPVAYVFAAETLRHKYLDRLAQQLLPAG